MTPPLTTMTTTETAAAPAPAQATVPAPATGLETRRVSSPRYVFLFFVLTFFIHRLSM